MGRPFTRSAAILMAAAQLAVLPCATAARGATTEEEAFEIGVEAYTYAYPLVLMELTRRNAVNVAGLGGVKQKMNQFRHAQAFPDASFKAVVRPNADTLYSSMWYDVSDRPLVISLPDTGGRYYVLPLASTSRIAATDGSISCAPPRQGARSRRGALGRRSEPASEKAAEISLRCRCFHVL